MQSNRFRNDFEENVYSKEICSPFQYRKSNENEAREITSNPFQYPANNKVTVNYLLDLINCGFSYKFVFS